GELLVQRVDLRAFVLGRLSWCAQRHDVRARRDRLEREHRLVAAVDEVALRTRDELRERAQLLEPLVEALRAQRHRVLALRAAHARGLAALDRARGPLRPVAVEPALATPPHLAP